MGNAKTGAERASKITRATKNDNGGKPMSRENWQAAFSTSRIEKTRGGRPLHGELKDTTWGQRTDRTGKEDRGCQI